ncbi:hypothetical protein JCM8097_004709 [Rhodosporidiobolus ruineniae]
MNQSTTGPCLVCGEETTSRCEACRQAGIDLFFCSREHQKLLWSVHKKVCGPGKANPFVWPDLSQEEADEAKKHLCTHIPEKAGRSTSLYAELKMLNWDHGHKDMLELLDELVEGRSCSLTLEEKDVTLLSVRAKEYDRLDAAGLWRPETIEGVLPAAEDPETAHRLLDDLAYALSAREGAI